MLELSHCWDMEELKASFRRAGRVRIPNFLLAEDAEAVYQRLIEVPWTMQLVIDGRACELPAPHLESCAEEERVELVRRAHANARDRAGGHAFEAYRLTGSRDATTSLDAFKRLVGSEPFLHLVGQVLELDRPCSRGLLATRLRAEHFSGYQGAILAKQDERKRGAFYYNLTPEWKAEWGGAVEFRSADGLATEGYFPCFNCLDLFALPVGHWRSVVAPFAPDSAYAISGEVCSEETSGS